MEIPMIDLLQITKTYYSKKNIKVHALKEIEFKVNKGEMIGITGRSGSGKSTLLSIIGGLTVPTSGIYKYEDEMIQNKNQRQLAQLRRNHFGFVVQDFALIPTKTVYENIELPLKSKGLHSEKRKVLINEILEKMQLFDKKRSYPTELSGGQQQRVAIGRALIHRPDVILADEPTGALDKDTAKEIIALFNEIHHQGITILIVTHDDRVLCDCNRIIRLEDGKIVY